jgi:predicted Fe-S protein YdhL (DUF1289 family)
MADIRVKTESNPVSPGTLIPEGSPALPERVQLALREGRPLPSPCLSICRIDEEAGWCEGCARTLDEIACWGSASNAQRLQIWLQVVQRQAGSASTSAGPTAGQTTP